MNRGRRSIRKYKQLEDQWKNRNAGLCPSCGKKPETEFRMCNYHREKAAKYQRERRKNSNRENISARRHRPSRSDIIKRKMIETDDWYNG